MQRLRVNRYTVLCGLIFILGICSTVNAKPANSNEMEDVMLSDDYDYYSDDQSSQGQQTKPANNPNATRAISTPKSRLTVKQFVGNNVTLQCDAKILKDEVILWYKDDQVISNGVNPSSPIYSIDPYSFALIIPNVTVQNQGEYLCEILPRKTRTLTSLRISEKPDEEETIVPESSMSFQNNGSSSLMSPLRLIFAFGIFLFLRK